MCVRMCVRKCVRMCAHVCAYVHMCAYEHENAHENCHNVFVCFGMCSFSSFPVLSLLCFDLLHLVLICYN
jgi:hypothetical protein